MDCGFSKLVKGQSTIMHAMYTQTMLFDGDTNTNQRTRMFS